MVRRIGQQRRGAELTYVRTADHFEVDFLARYPVGKPELIQVCADPDAPETRERETRALLAAADEHPEASLHLITLTTDTALGIPQNVTVHSATAWLLNTGESI